jgi:hypothetical protein
MLKTSTIVACVLAASGSAALAQTYSNAPSGAGGAAPTRDIGGPSANANATAPGGTQSTTVLSQSNKQQSAAGMPSGNYDQNMQGNYTSQAQAAQGVMQPGEMNNPNAAYITDEYGYQYNSRGDRIGRVRRR